MSQVITIGLDIAKSVFQLHGVDAGGAVLLRKRLPRSRMLAFFEKPYVKRQKNDAADAEAICEAVTRPSMRFVPIKAPEQQSMMVAHRARSILTRQRTQLSNAIRGHMMKPGTKHLVIDLVKMDYFGSEFIGALVSMLREVKTRGNKACLCCANAQMLGVLQNMSLFKLWPHYVTRDEAIAAASAE